MTNFVKKFSLQSRSRFGDKKYGVSKTRPKAGDSKRGWDHEAKNYDELVGERGHFFHESIVGPKLTEFIERVKPTSVIDFGCGQGFVERLTPSASSYLGIDSSKQLISLAQKRSKATGHEFKVSDATAKLEISSHSFDLATCILALQNMESASGLIRNLSYALKDGGYGYIVINHPHFRTPRATGWGSFDKGVAYRWVSRYLSSFSIPIRMHPSMGTKSPVTLSYHYSLEYLSHLFEKNGLSIVRIEEWASGKKSVGAKAISENRSRSEIPVFMGIILQRK
jgi:ubiquinone/menaquinone biosynthesis C-methylase UbiE